MLCAIGYFVEWEDAPGAGIYPGREAHARREAMKYRISPRTFTDKVDSITPGRLALLIGRVLGADYQRIGRLSAT